MTERTKTIKGLISGQVDMGTFGLVELELLAIEKENEALRKHAVSGSSFDWDKFANTLKDEFGESLVEENNSEEDPYNWWLTDVTVTDIVDFIKNYR
jgi:hypothetical protein